MLRLKFIVPTVEHYQDVMNFKEEFNDNEEYVIPGSALLDKILEYSLWLDHIEQLSNRLIELDDYVHSDVYLVYDKHFSQLVGIVHMRDELNENLPLVYGQISYSVRPSKRKNDYGKEVLELALSKMKDNNHKQIVLSCEHDNTASKRLIEKNGGIHLRDEIVAINKLFSVYLFEL